MLFTALGKAEPLISTAAPEIWPLPRPLTLTIKQGNSDVKIQFLAFDFDPWPTTLNYNLILAKVKVDPEAKNQGRNSNGSAMRAQTEHTRMDATKCIISLTLRLITIR